MKKKTPNVSTTARDARHREKTRATTAPTPTEAQVLYLAALSDQAKVILEQMATIAVLRTLIAPNAPALRADLQQLATAVSSLTTRVQELEARPAAPMQPYTPTDVQSAFDSLATIADLSGLQDWNTNTQEGRAAIVRAVEELRRGHDQCFEDLQRADRDRDRAIAEREDARETKKTADALLTQATQENAALRAHGMTLRQQLAEILAALGMPYHPEHYTDATHVVFVKMAAELRTAADLNTPRAPTPEVLS